MSLANLPLHIALVLTGQFPVPGGRPEPERPQTASDPGYLEFLEQNSHIIYPVIGLLVLVLIAAGILQAWKTQDLDGLAKAELRREVIIELRRQMGGVTAEDLARVVGLEVFRMNRLLEEMQTDGLLIAYTNTSHKKVWRVKGVGEAGVQPARRRRTASRR